MLETYSEYLFYIQLSKFEGNPKTILEAMGAGCVVITNNVYGIKNIIKHEENGILIKANDDLSLIIDNLLLDTGLINKISTNAKETVFDNFSYENYLSIEVKNYESLNNTPIFCYQLYLFEYVCHLCKTCRIVGRIYNSYIFICQYF